MFKWLKTFFRPKPQVDLIQVNISKIDDKIKDETNKNKSSNKKAVSTNETAYEGKDVKRGRGRPKKSSTPQTKQS
jgi:hypothetical protein